MFTRTLAGFKNYSLFTKKNIVAFCEGGPSSISVEDALRGKTNASAEDITFWEAVTAECSSRRTFHVKALGDCHAVMNMGAAIEAKGLTSTCIFLDRDWRDFTGELQSKDHVIYTPHYSWENTVVNPEVIAEAILSIGHLPRSKYTDAVSAAERYLEALRHALRLPLYMDISGFGSGASFLEKSERCGGAIDLAKSGQLSVNRTALRQRFRQQRHLYRRVINVTLSQVATFGAIPGHILMGAAICIVKSYLSGLGLKAHSSHAIRSTLLQCFRQLFRTDGWTHEKAYFRNELSRVPI